MILFNKIFKSKIEKKVEEHARLLIERQKVKSNVFTENSKLETKIKKLEYSAFLNKQRADKEISEIDRKLRKLEKDIDNEKEYINSLEFTPLASAENKEI